MGDSTISLPITAAKESEIMYRNLTRALAPGLLVTVLLLGGCANDEAKGTLAGGAIGAGAGAVVGALAGNAALGAGLGGALGLLGGFLHERSDE